MLNGCPRATPTSNFKELKVAPLFRCPDTDVRVHWSTSPPHDIKIILENHERLQGPEGDFAIPADDVNRLPSDSTITFKIDVAGGEEQKKAIHTFHEVEQVERTGLPIEGTSRFKVDLPEEVWDPKLEIRRVTLVSPRSYTCNQPNGETTALWQYDKTALVSGILTRDNAFLSTSGLPAPAAGVWFFTLQNFPQDQTCPGAKSLSLNPTISFTIGCPGR